MKDSLSASSSFLRRSRPVTRPQPRTSTKVEVKLASVAEGRQRARGSVVAIQVAVCGPRDAAEGERRDAFEVGRLLAERGAVVICGGYGGVMAAVAGGVHSAGGTVVGILSGA